MNGMVSIIVPVYNTEQHISECLNSLSSQNFNNIEIIVINDGSDDKSESIVKSHCDLDPRIKLFTIENGGVSNARRVGLSLANGDYVAFVDSDDIVPNCAISTMVNEITRNDVSFVIGNRILFGNENGRSYNLKNEIINNKEVVQRLMNKSVDWGLCGKLFKIDVLRNNMDVNKKFKIGEDLIVSLGVCASSTNIKIINNVCYKYRIHDSSTTRTFKHSIDYINEFLNEIESRFSGVVNKALIDNYAMTDILDLLIYYKFTSPDTKNAREIIMRHATKSSFINLSFKRKIVFVSVFTRINLSIVRFFFNVLKRFP